MGRQTVSDETATAVDMVSMALACVVGSTGETRLLQAPPPPPPLLLLLLLLSLTAQAIQPNLTVTISHLCP